MSRRDWTCEGCGAYIEAPDRPGIVEASYAHLAATHPEWGVTRKGAGDYWDALDRTTGGIERLERIGELAVRPASEDVAGVIDWFDREAFAGNPAWASCYCLFHHLGSDQAAWVARGADENRPELERRLRDGRTVGWVGRVDGRIAGWVNASPLGEYPDHGLGDLPADEVGAIVCFVVAPPYRRHGIARRLLDAALDDFRERGFRWAEAYPRREVRDDASAYTGPIGLYLDAGFERVGERDRSIVVRRRLP